jgi:rod shape determining protein RodA
MSQDQSWLREGVNNPLSARRTLSDTARLLAALKLDGPLLVGIALIVVYSLVVQYSASGQDFGTCLRTLERLGLGVVIMLALANCTPNFLRRLAPWLYGIGIVLLIVVDAIGYVGKGAQRWLDLGLFRFQPSEIMKLAVPMMAASFLHERPLPPDWRALLVLAGMILGPAALVAAQPDLGTAMLIAAAGFLLVLMAGLQWQIIAVLVVLGVGAAFVGWNFMHDYQRERIRVFLDPASDPLGSGYHITQSQIAIGSGGMFGKGWMNGSQTQQEFLPESSTDFIFAVIGEEFGLVGLLVLVGLYLFVVSRAVFLSNQTSDTFSRLLASSIAFTFFVYVFINTGMVSGILPVVGVPLPLVSYGGTAAVTLLAGFGILMGLHSHRKLVNT